MWVPPAAKGLVRRVWRGTTGLQGLEPNWAVACAKAGRYDADVILQRVRRTSRLAADRYGVADRDGVVLEDAAPPFPLIACLLRAGIRSGNGLTIIDFGGALGSSYRQCAPFLSAIEVLHWHVVEQAGFVACGRAEFQTDALRFFSTIEEAAAVAAPDVIMFSSVLQYLDDPYNVLRRASRTAPDAIVIDRTPLADRAEDAFTVQRVPEEIFPARLPLRIFSDGKFAEALAPDYRQVVEFQGVDADMWAGSLRVRFRGFLFERTAPIKRSNGVSGLPAEQRHAI